MLKNFTLLYVEDDKETVENIKEILQDKVKKLYVAYDGLEGIEVYKENKPDIVLTDINMPNLNGINMAIKIKEINHSQAILVLTAFNEIELLHKSIDIGVDGYITKPILNIDKLLTPLNKTADRLQQYIDQKKLEHLLEVQGKTAALGEMIGNIAHQWRQPLSVISALSSNMNLQVDLNENISNENIVECSEQINKQVQYLSKTIDNFRDYLKADISRKEFFDIQDCLEKTKELVSITMKENHIQYIESWGKYRKVFGNENQLIQVIINIFNNAKDSLQQIEDINNRYLFVTTEVENNTFKIIIKDSGVGIKDDIIDKIFEPYFTTKHQSVGTGIGLFMSYNIIQKMFQGTIEVDNVEYEYANKKLFGVQFTINIPIK